MLGTLSGSTGIRKEFLSLNRISKYPNLEVGESLELWQNNCIVMTQLLHAYFLVIKPPPWIAISTASTTPSPIGTSKCLVPQQLP